MGTSGKGWIKLNRDILDHWLWTEKPFDKKSAWIDLLLLANHQDAKYFVRGKLVKIKRGQYGTSAVKLASRWGWTRKKVIGFLRELEKDQMLIVEGTSQGTTLTIVNYEKFQNQGTTQRTPQEQLKGQLRNSSGDTNKNDIRMTKNEKEVLPPEEVVGVPDEEIDWGEE